MFRSKKEMTIGIIVSSLVIITIIGLVYAAFTQQLNIGGSGNARNSVWHVYFSDLSNAALVGTATEETHPTIQDNATSIKTYAVSVATPGDSITYTFKVNNDGDYDAKLTGLTLNTPSCTGTDSTSNTNVCSKLRYTLKYENGTSVAENDMLASKESKTMVLKLEYQEFDDASLLPTANVTIGNLGIDLVYTQEGKAKVNANGTTPYVDPYSHHVGDTFTLNGDGYHIIADSPTSDDYVVALKDNPLTVSELENAGATNVSDITYWDSQNQQPVSTGYGGIKYHASSNVYATSDIKSVVDTWATSKFTNGELRTVDGYSARLIKTEDLITNLGYQQKEICSAGNCANSILQTNATPSWIYNSQYTYWTMSPWNDSASNVWDVRFDGALTRDDVNFDVDSGGAVRPVINVKKSTLSSS